MPSIKIYAAMNEELHQQEKSFFSFEVKFLLLSRFVPEEVFFAVENYHFQS
jgi:hypothetical protein